MNPPRIIVTGDFLRPGQDGNISFFWAALRDLIKETFDVTPALVKSRPIAWDSWRMAQQHSPGAYAALGTADLVIGFELPPAARAEASNWINVRRHPLRYDRQCVPFSFATSFPTSWKGDQFQATPCELKTPPVKVTPGCEKDIAVMLQMQTDSSLLFGDRLALAHEVAPAIAMLVEKEGFERVWIVPHPNEPINTWVEACKAAIPRALMWTGTAYDAMASMRRMITVSSSTGFEAPAFGCSPSFIRKPDEPSAPYEINDRDLWFELSSKFRVACNFLGLVPALQ